MHLIKIFFMNSVGYYPQEFVLVFMLFNIVISDLKKGVNDETEIC